jgi:hypothetical protein
LLFGEIEETEMRYRKKEEVLAWQYHPEASVPHWITDKIGTLPMTIPVGRWLVLSHGTISQWSEDVFPTVFEPIT